MQRIAAGLCESDTLWVSVCDLLGTSAGQFAERRRCYVVMLLAVLGLITQKSNILHITHYSQK